MPYFSTVFERICLCAGFLPPALAPATARANPETVHPPDVEPAAGVISASDLASIRDSAPELLALLGAALIAYGLYRRWAKARQQL